jgi:hypothetical protein
MDGVLIQGRVQDQWLEMKVGSFFSQTAEVSRDRREVLDASFVGSACQAWQEFEQPVTLEAQRRGLRCDEPIEFIADGASGIWSLQEVVFPNSEFRMPVHAWTSIMVNARLPSAWPRPLATPQRRRCIKRR